MIGTNWPVFLAARLVGGWRDVNQISPAICKWQSSPPQRWKWESGSLASALAGDLLTPVITWARATIVIMLVFYALFPLPLSFFLLQSALTLRKKYCGVWGWLVWDLIVPAFIILLKVETLEAFHAHRTLAATIFSISKCCRMTVEEYY